MVSKMCILWFTHDTVRAIQTEFFFSYNKNWSIVTPSKQTSKFWHFHDFREVPQKNVSEQYYWFTMCNGMCTANKYSISQSDHVLIRSTTLKSNLQGKSFFVRLICRSTCDGQVTFFTELLLSSTDQHFVHNTQHSSKRRIRYTKSC